MNIDMLIQCPICESSNDFVHTNLIVFDVKLSGTITGACRNCKATFNGILNCEIDIQKVRMNSDDMVHKAFEHGTSGPELFEYVNNEPIRFEYFDKDTINVYQKKKFCGKIVRQLSGTIFFMSEVDGDQDVIPRTDWTSYETMNIAMRAIEERFKVK